MGKKNESPIKLYDKTGENIQALHHETVKALNADNCIVTKIECVANEDAEDLVGSTMLIYFKSLKAEK